MKCQRDLARECGKPVNEGAISQWLDEIYSGEIAHRWQAEFALAAKEFEENCIHTLRPFESDPLLEDAFYQAFEGLEVLPASYYDEYQALKIEDPIRANELLVPITIGRFHALCNSGNVWPREKREPFVIKTPYSSERGLRFNK